MAQRFKAKTLISNSGVFNNEVIAPNLVYNTGNQTIGGLKTFSNGFISSVGITGTNLVFNTGDQTIAGLKTFSNGVISSVGVTGTNLVYNTGNQTIAGLKTFSNGVVSSVGITGTNLVFNTGDQTIAGLKTFSNGVISSVGITGTNLVYNTGNQTISGVKTFASFPTVNGTGIVYTLGNQDVSGQKRFIDEDIIISTSFNSAGNPSTFIGYHPGPGAFYFKSVAEYRPVVYPNPNFYYTGVNVNNQIQIYYNTGTSRWWFTYDGSLLDASPIVSPNFTNTRLPLNNWSGGYTKIYPTYSHNISHYIDGNDPIDVDRINGVAKTGDQTISGVKTFATGIVAPNIVYNTGDQIISGFKTFADDLSIKNNAFFISQASGFLSGSNYYGNYNGGVFAGGIRLSQSSLALVENSFSTKWNPSEGNAGSTSRNWKRIVINGLGKYQIGIVYGGTVYVSDNYGENFSPKTSIVGASNNWSDVAISTDGKYSIASVDQGYVWLSDNYGTNWTQSNILGIGNWKCVALSSTAQYQIAISQDSETIVSLWISKNYGKNWSSSAITAKNASSVTISSDGKYQRIALYSDQNSLYSNNYGNTWTSTTQQTTGCSHTRISSDGAYQLLSTDEYVKISKDYGITWVDEFRTPNNKIKDLTISANAHFQAIAVENNYIYASYNYGKSGTWEQVGLSGNWSTIDINSNGKNLTAAMSGVTSGFVFVSNTDEKVRGDLYADHIEALNLVYNTGDQIISGQKTFAKGTSFSGGSLSISGDSIENYNLIFSKFSRETATFSIIGFQKTAGSVNPASVTTSQPHNFKIGDSVAISDIRTLSCASSSLNGSYIISNIISPTIFQYLTPGNEGGGLGSSSFVSLLTTCSNAPTATAFSYFSKSSSLGSNINVNSNDIISNSPFIAPNLVYNTGNQTISGVKTFANSGIFSLSGIVPLNVASNPLSIVGSGNTYIQLNIQNRATGLNATSDLVLTANNGTDSANYINLGINNSGYNDGGFTNGTGLDGYLFIDGGNLDIGTKTFGKFIEFHAGGTAQNNTIARINSQGLDIISGTLNAANVVYNTGNQTISGVKTFATGIITSGNLQVSGTGIFNAIDLNSIDNLSLSGVDVTITSGVVTLTNPLSAPNLVYNTGNQTISGVKTFIGNHIISGNLTVSGNIINSGIADIFPASPTKRRYYPEGFLTMSSASPIYQSIQYFPFLIKKDAINPKICVEVATVGSVATPIRYGIYSGNNGFEGAKLFHSGSIDCLNILGVYTGDINTTLVKGPYIIATSNTGVNGGQPLFRTFAASTVRSIFGEPTGFSTLSIGSPYYNETGIDLLTTIGSGIINSSVQAPAPAIIY